MPNHSHMTLNTHLTDADRPGPCKPDSGQTGTVVLSPDLCLMGINPQAIKILGTVHQPAAPLAVDKMWAAGSAARASKCLKQALDKGLSVDHERLTLVHASGRKVPCHVSMCPLFGRAQCITGVMIRFSRRMVTPGPKKPGRGLPFLPRLDYPDLFDGLPLGVFSIDSDRRIIAFNRQAGDLTGFRPEAVIGKPCYQILQRGDCRHDCPFTDLFDNGMPVSRKEMTLIDTSGANLRISLKTNTLTDSKGTITGGIASFGRSSGLLNRPQAATGPGTFEGMIGQSRAMQSLFEKLSDIAQSPVSVLITGESGTGKDMVARAIHNLSDRKAEPFQVVNCSALAETLLESELFGHEKGAFTGAEQSKPGRFELAANGTFFLDEIGEMKPALQVKLLRVLEQKEFERVGSDRTLKMTARIIAATHHNLEGENSNFRPDLYYRLRTIPLHLPPLRERRDDIPLLVNHFIAMFNSQYNKQVRLLDPAVQHLFAGYDWPGNVRELARVMEHAFVFVKGPIIFLHHLPDNPAFHSDNLSTTTIRRPATEKERIARALESAGQKRDKAAQLLGISRSTLWRKMKALGLIN